MFSHEDRGRVVSPFPFNGNGGSNQCNKIKKY